MLAVGRRRTTNLGLPAGVRERAGRWYWQPTRESEREQRRKAGLKNSTPLGKAGTVAARKLWAELTGLRESEVAGTVEELLSRLDREGMERRPNGEPRSWNTVKQYRACLPAIRERFAAAKYGKTEFEAARGQAIGTADIQRFVLESGSMGKKRLAVLKNAFDHGIRSGLTTYNPCDKAVPPAQDARTREPQEWEVECLSTVASQVLALMMAMEGITGWRISDILRTIRGQFTADGLRVRHGKGGKRRLWQWSDELRRIFNESAALPCATVFPASPVFPNQRGKAYGYSGFNTAWQDTKEATNGWLSAGIVDPDSLKIAPGLSIEDLHFHDLRSKAHDDAEDAGEQGHEFLGNTKRVAKKHYRRREEKVRPLK